MASVIALGRRRLIEKNIERITHDAMQNLNLKFTFKVLQIYIINQIQ